MADEKPVDKTSFKSAYYDELDAKNEQAEGIKPGLVKAIRVRGEASNADQVSPAGAQTVYQIIPSTRDLALKKWGVDAYLSPENAALVAAKLVREAQDRHKGDAAAIAADYNAGPDKSKWNNDETRAYVKRVAGRAPSTLERLTAKSDAGAPSALTNIYNAYKDGTMTAEDRTRYETDVREGRVLLPRGAMMAPGMVKPKESPNATPKAPEGVINAWKDQAMSPAEAGEFEKDVREGRIEVPADVKKMIGADPGVLSRTKDAALEAVSGARRETESTRNLRDYTQLPELNGISTPILKTAVRTLFGDTEEKIKAIKENFPGIEVTRDEKGNPILKSKETGESFAIPPGFTLSDAPAAVAGLATAELGGGGALAPAAGVVKQAAVNAGGQAAAQAAVEGAKSAAGGEADLGNIAIAAGGGAAAPIASRVIDAALPPVVNAVKNVVPGAAARQAQANVEARVMQPAAAPAPARTPPIAATPNVEPAPKPAAAVEPVAPSAKPVEAAPPVAEPGTAPTSTEAVVVPAGGPSVDELGVLLRKAANGDKKAEAQLAAHAAQDPQIIKDAEALGMRIEPVQATKSQSFREIVQGVKSIPGSDRTVELQNLAHNQEVANGIITRLGGSHDLSDVNAATRKALDDSYKVVKAGAKKEYDEIRAAIPSETPAPATDTLSFLEERAKKLGGVENLSPEEKTLLKKLSPKSTGGESVTEEIKNPLTMQRSNVTRETSSPTIKQPTYDLLDQARRDIGEAKRGLGGEFGSADKRLLGQLEEHLSNDQGRVAAARGMDEQWSRAKAATREYKKIEEKLETLFGKNLQGSIVGDMKAAVGKLSEGDETKLVNLISAIPQELRHQVVASGLASAFGMNAKNHAINFNSYAKWFDGMAKNSRARNALFSNLPPESVKMLTSLANVSKGIAAANAARITTGRVNALLLGGDSLLEKIYSVGRKAGASVAAEAASSAVGLPGAGLSAGIAAALTKPKANVMKAADALISSPEFAQAIRTGSKQDIKRLANSGRFHAFRKAAGSPHEMKDAERWITAALIAYKTNEGNK